MPIFALYSTDIFDKISGDGKEVTFFIGIAKVMGGVFGVFFIRCFGRKFNVVFGILIQTLCLATIGFAVETGNTFLPYPIAFLFTFAYGVGVGANFLVYAAEVLNPISASFAGTLVALSSAVLSKLIPLIFLQLSLTGLMFIFTIICLVMVLLIDCFVIETKGKKDAQVIEEFKTRRYRLFDFK